LRAVALTLVAPSLRGHPVPSGPLDRLAVGRDRGELAPLGGTLVSLGKLSWLAFPSGSAGAGGRRSGL